MSTSLIPPVGTVVRIKDRPTTIGDGSPRAHVGMVGHVAWCLPYADPDRKLEALGRIGVRIGDRCLNLRCAKAEEVDKNWWEYL